MFPKLSMGNLICSLNPPRVQTCFLFLLFICSLNSRWVSFTGQPRTNRFVDDVEETCLTMVSQDVLSAGKESFDSRCDSGLENQIAMRTRFMKVELQRPSSLRQRVVARDDNKIAECCQGFGADVVVTSVSCRNGTEHCNEALQKLEKKYDVVANIQGDEPLIEP